MPPVVHKVIDVAAAIALTAAAVFVIVAVNAFLMSSHAGSFTGFRLWYGFIGRPDILGTMILTALISFLYAAWQQRRRPRP